MDIKSLDGETYVPEFNGNRKLPKGEQVTVTLRYPTIEQYEPFAGSRDKDPDALGLIRFAVTGIRNLAENGKAIETGGDLVACRRGLMSDLVNELFVHILTVNRMSGAQEKNSGGRSSSS